MEKEKSTGEWGGSRDVERGHWSKGLKIVEKKGGREWQKKGEMQEKTSFQKKRRKMCRDLKYLRLIQVHVSNKFCN